MKGNLFLRWPTETQEPLECTYFVPPTRPTHE